MSINQKANQSESITLHYQALKFFTDRYELISSFVQHLNDNPSHEKILFFYGDGGNGKSLLLSFLKEKCCKLILSEKWQTLKLKSDIEIVNYIENLETNKSNIVPAVLLDFALTPSDTDQPQHPFYGLVMLQRYLIKSAKDTGYSLKFPLFSYGCCLYLYKTQKESQLNNILPMEEINFVSEMINLFTEIPGMGLGKSILNLIEKRTRNSFTLYRKKIGLDEDLVHRLNSLKPESELIQELPRLLAQDLNIALTSTDESKFRRIVLLFDGHERFWGIEKAKLQGENYHIRDEWLRAFLCELELTSGIIVVVAGREPPKWFEATKEKTIISNDFLETKLVANFSKNDSFTYLKKVNVNNQNLSNSIIKEASVSSNQIHPLHLGLCVDYIRMAQRKGVTLTGKDFSDKPELANDLETKRKRLIDCILRYADRELIDAVYALGACRTFDFELYQAICEELNLSSSITIFDILLDFSFVWHTQTEGKDRYRIHDLVRRLNYERKNPVTIKAHEFLMKYYGEQQEIAEMIYHGNRLNWFDGIQVWINIFDNCLELSQYTQCQTLLDLLEELIIKDELIQGRTYQLKGNYFLEISRYREAEAAYKTAIQIYETIHQSETKHSLSPLEDIFKGETLTKVGIVYEQQALYDLAKNHYLQAITELDQLLRLYPSDFNILNFKGIALRHLGELEATLFQYNQAVKSYELGIQAFTEAISLTEGSYHVLFENQPENADLKNGRMMKTDQGMLSNLGDIFGKLGRVQEKLGQKRDALKTYTQALEVFAEAVTPPMRDPNNRDTLNNQGLAYIHLASLQEELGEIEEAIGNFQKAIGIYKKIFSRSPNDVYALDNYGLTLLGLAQIQTKQQQYEKALRSLEQALSSYEKAIHIAPIYDSILINQGNVYKQIAEVYSKTNNQENTIKNYEQAISAYELLLSNAPSQIIALENKVRLLIEIGLIKKEQQKYSETLNYFNSAVTLCNEILVTFPEELTFIAGKAQILHLLGNLNKKMSQSDEALKCYQESLKLHNHINLSEIDLREEKKLAALLDKAETYGDFATIQFEFGKYHEALENYAQSITIFKLALNQSNTNLYIYGRIAAYQNIIGSIQKEFLNQPNQAFNTYQEAIKTFEKALKLNYNDSYSLYGLQLALRSAGLIQFQLNKIKQALILCQKEYEVNNKILHLDTKNIAALVNQIDILMRLGETNLELNKMKEARSFFELAIQTCKKISQLKPDNKQAKRTIGFALAHLGDVQESLGQQTKASKNYAKAIDAYNKFLKIEPEDIELLFQKAATFSVQGDLKIKLGRFSEAIKSYQDRIETFKQLHALKPNDEKFLMNQGATLNKISLIEISQHELLAAIQNYQNSIYYYEEAIKLNSEYVDAYYNQGNSLKDLGDIFVQLLEYNEAINYYNQAVKSYNEALKYSPQDIDVLNNKGLALHQLADTYCKLLTKNLDMRTIINKNSQLFKTIQKKLQQKSSLIIDIYHQAYTSYQKILDIKLQSGACYNQANSSQSLAKFLMSLQRYNDAEKQYELAIKCYNQSHQLSPKDVHILNNRGLTLKNLGVLQEDLLDQNDKALQSYQEAVNNYEKLARLNSDFFMGYSNQGLALTCLGNIQLSQLNQPKEAIQNYKKAIKACNNAIRIASKDANSHMNKGFALHNLGLVLFSQSKNEEAFNKLQQALEAFKTGSEIEPNRDYFLWLKEREESLLSGCKLTIKSRELLGDLSPIRLPYSELLPPF